MYSGSITHYTMFRSTMFSSCGSKCQNMNYGQGMPCMVYEVAEWTELRSYLAWQCCDIPILESVVVHK